MNKERINICFRADAGVDIGYGHFIRTLALADMLRDDFDCTFFTQTPTQYQKKEVANVCKLVELPSDDSKFQKFVDMLLGDEIVVLDNYFFTPDYQQQIKDKGCKLVCIDDMHDKHYVADVVINHGLTDKSLFSIEPYTKLCLGLDWALLRKPFLSQYLICERDKGRCVVAFGGVDSLNLSTKFAKILSLNENIKQITVIIGDSFAYFEDLCKIPKVDIVKNLDAQQIANLFKRVEFAVLPTSTICIEALACGCKIYGGYYVDNQVEFYNELAIKKAIKSIGELSKYEKFHYLCDSKTSYKMDSTKIRDKYINLFKKIKA